MCNVEYKKSIIESTINSAKLYNNENDKKSAYDVDDNIDLLELNDLNIDEEINDDFLSIIQMNETEQSKFIINKIETKVKILKYFWKKLNKRTQDYNFYLINLYQSLQQLNKICDSVNQKFNEYEQLISKLEEYSENSKEKLINENEKLAENLNYIKNLQSGLNKCQSQIEDMNLKYRNLKDELIQISPPVISIDDRCNDLNKRWLALNSLLQEKYDNLYNLIEISGADIFLKLSGSVKDPWQRGLSQINKLPYYINHSTQTTTWEHPKMNDLYKSFNNLNDIRFSAYRTSMKLRTLQKRLWLDLVDINDVVNAFDKHGLKNNINERNIEINQIILCLNSIFQSSSKQHSQILNLVHAVDLTLNWLLSVYDPYVFKFNFFKKILNNLFLMLISSRCGQIRVLSFKVAIVLLSKGLIEEKYKYIYSLIENENNLATQRKLGLLLYEMIMIPKQLGEVAAFGGSNIEPSVRSCFEYVIIFLRLLLFK